MNPEEIARYQGLAREVIANPPPYPKERYTGRGVVVCGGGARYFTCAYVCLSMLRQTGCRLPVELWHLGPLEMNDDMRALVAPLDVTCVDASEMRKEQPVLRLHGWELKPYSILHSRFEEVLFLDADNVPLVNPEVFFTCAEYERTGALFWPDFSPLDRKNPIWELAEVEYRYEPSFESGQLVVDKRRCWAELQLTMHYNEHSDCYYRHTGGDKDTFHIAWRRLGRPYAMIPHHVQARGGVVMCQHDFTGEVVFQHRNNAKWTLDLDANPRVAGFRHEGRCLEILRELAARWNGDPARLRPDSPQARRLHDEIEATEKYVYDRVGHDRRVIRLHTDQSISGAGSLETSWFVMTREDGEPVLCIAGSQGITCLLAPRGDGALTGRWELFERMPIDLLPLSLVPAEDLLQIERDARHTALCGLAALVVHVRRERRLVRFEPGGGLSSQDGSPDGWRWGLRCRAGELALELTEADGSRRLLFEEPDGVFRGEACSGRDRVEVIPLPGLKLP